MARKKEERAARAAQKKEKLAQKYLTDDEASISFALQLNKLGLQLRNIPGDGNCLFRALGDQLDGHGRSHRNHRHDVVKYMSEHRADFEPFVEDDVPFEQHVKCLGCPGTYAGNDAIVAFARLHQVTIVIHQLNSPIWEIHGSEKANGRQIHISYHNGDHYSSVRSLGDSSETPANIRFVNGQVLQNVKLGNKELKKFSPSGPNHPQHPHHRHDDDDEDDDNEIRNGFDDYTTEEMKNEAQDIIDNIIMITNCTDKTLIRSLLDEYSFDYEMTVAALIQIMSGSSQNSSCQQTSSDSDTPTTPNGRLVSVNGDVLANSLDELDRRNQATIASSKGAIPKSRQGAPGQNRKTMKRERKQEKKARAEERHRQAVLGIKPDPSKLMSSDDDDNNIHTVITENLKVLQI